MEKAYFTPRKPMEGFMKKFVLFLAVLSMAAAVFTGCKKKEAAEVKVFKLSHGQAQDSEIGATIAYIRELVQKDKTKGLDIEVYASGVLGTERENIEMVKTGFLDMAKISANSLGQFDDRFTIFTLPYLFTGQEHYYEALAKSGEIKKLFDDNNSEGFVAIGYYANGARSFYLKENIPVTSPAVLRGKKIRSMPNTASMDMIQAMGGSPVPMSADETYTALQQGVVDGAENTELALTVNKHAEICKSYTYTEHQYTPDIYIISTKAWNALSKEQQNYLKEAFVALNANFTKEYNRMMTEAIEQSQKMGVTIYRDIDKTEFIRAVQPLHKAFTEKGDKYRVLYEDIQKYDPMRKN
jgi:tripartite ATP-independent transporter DctP family solute receptor